MKQIHQKVFLAFILAALGMSNAIASTAYYGAAKKTTHASPQITNVVVHNRSYDTYTVYATFQNSGKSLILPLGRIGSGTDVITYEINYPDYQVCFNVVRDYDGYLDFQGCLSYGDLPIPYYGFKK